MLSAFVLELLKLVALRELLLLLLLLLTFDSRPRAGIQRSFSLSLSHTHTHSLSVPLSHSYSHTHTLTLSPAVDVHVDKPHLLVISVDFERRHCLALLTLRRSTFSLFIQRGFVQGQAFASLWVARSTLLLAAWLLPTISPFLLSQRISLSTASSAPDSELAYRKPATERASL